MTDIGLRVLDNIHRQLRIDEEWTTRKPRSFSWIGSRLEQTFHATELFEDADMLVCRVVARTPAVRQISASVADVQREVLLLNRLAVGSAWIYDERSQTLSIALACTVHEQTEAVRSGQIADYAILQLIEAERSAQELALTLGGDIAIAEHPARGRRAIPDEMLGLLTLVHERSGERSLFADHAELRRVEQFANDAFGLAFSAGASDVDVAVEVPFGNDDTSLIYLHAGAPHPVMGNGLLVTSQFRVALPIDAAMAHVHALNAGALEPQSVMPLFGAWTVTSANESFAPAFSTFIPNLMGRPGVAVDAASSALFRATLYDRFQHPTQPPATNVLEIIRRRTVRPGG